jgi:hypothetical protein
MARGLEDMAQEDGDINLYREKHGRAANLRHLAGQRRVFADTCERVVLTNLPALGPVPQQFP